MKNEQVTQIIWILKLIQSHPNAWFSDTAPAINNFMAGFSLASKIFMSADEWNGYIEKIFQ